MCKLDCNVIKFANLEPQNNLLFQLDPKIMIKYLFCGKMGSFAFTKNTVQFVPDAKHKYIKLPHFFLVNPFEIANLLHSHNKYPFHSALMLIRDCIDAFTEYSTDKIGLRIRYDTTRSGSLNVNPSLQSPSLQVRPVVVSESSPALKELYDGNWTPLSRY